MTDEETILRAEEARKLLKNPILVRAIEEIKSDAFNQICESNNDEFDKREGFYALLKAIKLLEVKIKQTVNAGIKASKKGSV